MLIEVNDEYPFKMGTDMKSQIVRDTKFVLNKYYGREALYSGLYGADSPIFNALAAERFAR